jgi:hypothetical protein
MSGIKRGPARIHSGGGNSPLHFTPVGPAEMQGCVRVKMTYCEDCTGSYCRPVDEAHLRNTCPRCIRKAEQRLARDARELLVARNYDPRKDAGAQKMMPMTGGLAWQR